MEKINIRTKLESPLVNNKAKLERRTLTCSLDSFLLEKGRNFIKSQQLGGNYQFNSITDLVVESLSQFQHKELELVGDRNLQHPRQITSFSLPVAVAEFYLSLPKGQRTGILERCLSNFLKKLT